MSSASTDSKNHKTDNQIIDQQPPNLENFYLTTAAGGQQLVLTLEQYEGPLELLLDLARQQKVDLRQISMSLLVDQYIIFIEKIKKTQINIAAEYLVMAAYLTYLKSKLLLPEPDTTIDEPNEALLARRMLIMLDAMKKRAIELFARPRTGQDFFLKGIETLPEVEVTTELLANVELLISAYAGSYNAKPVKKLEILPTKLTSPEMALARLKKLLPHLTDWTDLLTTLEKYFETPLQWRAAYASTLFAALELARQGVLEITQEKIFDDVKLRQKSNGSIIE